MSAEGAGVLFLKPGQIVVSSQPLLVTTLLGSCVAVTMFCVRLKTGGICHAQLPSCRDREAQGRAHPGRFMDLALREMLARLLERGALAAELEVKVFGGSDMFQGRGRGAVGRQNAETALAVLARESIKVANQDLYGERGRKIIFHTHTGAVFLKRLNRSGVC